MPRFLLILFLITLFAVAVLSGYYFYNFGINRVYKLEDAYKNAAKDCKASFPELFAEHKTITTQEQLSASKEKMQEYKEYISSLYERVGIKVGSSPDYQIIDNLEYYNLGTKISGSQGCWAIIYTKEGKNYFVYEKKNENIVQIIIDKVQ